MKFLTLLASIMILVGCASNQCKPNIQYEKVVEKVPVYTPPSALKDIATVERPNLDVNALTTDSKNNPDVVIRAQLSTINQLIKYSEDLEQTIDTYKFIVNTPSTTQDTK
jgi:hypothetical protein